MGLLRGSHVFQTILVKIRIKEPLAQKIKGGGKNTKRREESNTMPRERRVKMLWKEIQR